MVTTLWDWGTLCAGWASRPRSSGWSCIPATLQLRWDTFFLNTHFSGLYSWIVSQMPLVLLCFSLMVGLCSNTGLSLSSKGKFVFLLLRNEHIISLMFHFHPGLDFRLDLQTHTYKCFIFTAKLFSFSTKISGSTQLKKKKKKERKAYFHFPQARQSVCEFHPERYVVRHWQKQF